MALVLIDEFVRIHSAEWDRLDSLARRATGAGRLDQAEAGELLDLYLRASAHLAHVQTHYRDRELIRRLTRTVGAANGVIYGSRRSPRRAFGDFFSITFPAAVWFHRRAVLVAALLFVVPAAVMGVWLANSSVALEASAPAEVRDAYVAGDFEDYYSSEPAATFSTGVLVNNIQVSFLAFAAGVLLGLPTVLLLVQNGLNLGFGVGLMTFAGRSGLFWGLILPHGLLEISAIVVAGGAGLALGWSIIDPGDRPRLTSLAEQGHRSVTVVLGLIPMFVTAGLIEGFVTPSDLPTVGRVGIGIAVFTAFWIWIAAWGSRAVSLGYTGLIGESPTTDRQHDTPVSPELTPA